MPEGGKTAKAAKKNLHQRICSVMEKLTSVALSDKKVNNQYSFVSHNAVTGALHGPLAKAGVVVSQTLVSYRQDGNRTEAIYLIALINADDPADRLEVEALGFGIDGQDKGPGKAASYALKTALLKLFLLEAGEPDNEVDLVDHKPAAKPARSSEPRRMAAKFGSKIPCEVCGSGIEQGDEIAYEKGSPVLHWDCYKRGNEPPKEVQNDDDLPF